jgi:hypothetical protein
LIRPKRRDSIVEREVDSELVLHDPMTDRTLLLNSVSAAIWDLCDGARTVDEIARCIAEHFRGSEDDEILRDTVELVGKLQAENVLEEC